jgi:putative hydrolase of the HAD superfamily
MGTIRFTRYQSQFQEAMLALHRSSIVGFDLGMSQQQDEADLMDIERIYLLEGGEFLLGFLDDVLIAMGGFRKVTDQVAELRRMRIDPASQGRGYGSCMLRELEMQALKRGFRTLCLETARRRPLTLAFYRKHGYEECGAGIYGAVETVQFRKTLNEQGSNLPMIEAVGFDLGETLLFYQDTPLSWESLYLSALEAVARALHLTPSKACVEAAHAVLRQYNTRIAPRTREIEAKFIFGQVLTLWDVPASPAAITEAIASFFGFFQQRICCYPDTVQTLRELHGRVPVGILTDVAYGMPASYVERDLREAKIQDLIDVLLTSGEVGWRKPSPNGYVRLAELLGTQPNKLLFIGNEPKDIAGALAAGALAVFLDHNGSDDRYGQHFTIRCLAELPRLLKSATRGCWQVNR